MSVEIRSAIDAAHRNIVHPFLTRGEAQNDREIAHERALNLMGIAQRVPLAIEIMDRMFSYDDPILRTSFAGLEAPNPLGIAAGFDKNARVHRLYEYIGNEIPIHRIGGIMNVNDVWEALTYGGATTVDVYTSFVRQETSTPNFAFYMLRDLAKAMRAYGMTSMVDFKGLRGKKVPFPEI